VKCKRKKNRKKTTSLVNKNMSIEEVSKLENIMRRIEVYIGLGMPLTLVVANAVRVRKTMEERKNNV